MTQTKPAKIKPYPLRMADDLKAWVQARANGNDRSMNAELNRLIRQIKEAEEESQTT